MRLSVPAVKAVWLPPPWQAMAILAAAAVIERPSSPP
jgi:hypothetical protein